MGMPPGRLAARSGKSGGTPPVAKPDFFQGVLHSCNLFAAGSSCLFPFFVSLYTECADSQISLKRSVRFIRDISLHYLSAPGDKFFPNFFLCVHCARRSHAAFQRKTGRRLQTEAFGGSAIRAERNCGAGEWNRR
jgi:hypothetical protein